MTTTLSTAEETTVTGIDEVWDEPALTRPSTTDAPTSRLIEELAMRSIQDDDSTTKPEPETVSRSPDAFEFNVAWVSHPMSDTASPWNTAAEDWLVSYHESTLRREVVETLDQSLSWTGYLVPPVWGVGRKWSHALVALSDLRTAWDTSILRNLKAQESLAAQFQQVAAQVARPIETLQQRAQAAGSPTATDTAELVERSISLLGKKLTAYLAELSSTQAVDDAGQGNVEISSAAVQRIRIAMRAAEIISGYDGRSAAQVWLQGRNRHLSGTAPARILLERGPEKAPDVLAAARAFVAGT